MLKKKFSRGVCVGSALSAGILSLFQDYLGLEGFIEHCRNHWISATYSVPLALVGVGAAVAVAVAELRRDESVPPAALALRIPKGFRKTPGGTLYAFQGEVPFKRIDTVETLLDGMPLDGVPLVSYVEDDSGQAVLKISMLAPRSGGGDAPPQEN